MGVVVANSTAAPMLQELTMSDAPLMPKATAVWLVENTSLTFDQIANFCKLHPLEVKGIADGEVAAGIKGHDPIASGQLTRESMAASEKDAGKPLILAVSKVKLPEQKRRGPRYTPLSRRQDRPNAILWLVRNHPELKDAQIMRLVGTTKTTLAGDPYPHALEFLVAVAARSGDARPLLADGPRPRGQPGGEGPSGRSRRIAARRWSRRRSRRALRHRRAAATCLAMRRHALGRPEEDDIDVDSVFGKLKGLKSRD